MAIFTYIRTGRDCATAKNWSIKVPRTDMKIDFQRGTSERDLLNILDFKPSAHDVAVGEQLSGPMYVDRSCLLPKERHEPCIPHYPTSHKYPTEPTLMSIPWICSNIQSDSSVVQDTGLTIISKINTTLNITTCYANNTFTIPISSGVTAVNLVNENQTRCDNGAKRYSYILPSPRVHGYTVSPASTTQNITDWMKISERQRTRYDKATYKHLFQSNTFEHMDLGQFNITPGDTLFEQERAKLPQDTFTGMTNLTISDILPDSWNPLDWLGIDPFGWVHDIIRIADSAFYIILALIATATALACLVCVIRCQTWCLRSTPQAQNAFQLDIRTTTEGPAEDQARSGLPRVQRRMAEVREALIQEGNNYNQQQLK